MLRINIAVVFSILYILFFVLIVVAKIFRIRVISQRGAIKLSFAVFLLSLCILSFWYNPASYEDLWHHFQMMDSMRKSKISFLEVIHGDKVGNYENYISFNLYRYLLVHMSNNNHWLSFFTVFIVYSIIFYLLFQIAKSSKYYFSISFFAFSFAFLPYFRVNSGIRNGLSCAIMGFALFLYLYKKKSTLTFALLSLVSVTIHPVSLIVIPFAIIGRHRILSWLMKFMPLMFLSVRFLLPQSSVFNFLNTESDFFKQLGSAYSVYISEHQFRTTMHFMYTDIILIVCLILAYMLVDRDLLKYTNPEIYTMNRVIVYYCLSVLMFIGNYDLVLRPLYLIGVLAPFPAFLLYEKRIWKVHTRGIRPLLVLISTMAATYTILRYMRYYFITHFDNAENFIS